MREGLCVQKATEEGSQNVDVLDLHDCSRELSELKNISGKVSSLSHRLAGRDFIQNTYDSHTLSASKNDSVMLTSVGLEFVDIQLSGTLDSAVCCKLRKYIYIWDM